MGWVSGTKRDIIQVTIIFPLVAFDNIFLPLTAASDVFEIYLDHIFLCLKAFSDFSIVLRIKFGILILVYKT